MLRVLLAVVTAGLAAAVPALAQQAQHHALSTSDTPNRIEPPTFPGARLAIAPHFHKAVQNLTVLAGSFHVGMGEKFDQGSGKELPDPTDITFVNPADDSWKK